MAKRSGLVLPLKGHNVYEQQASSYVSPLSISKLLTSSPAIATQPSAEEM